MQAPQRQRPTHCPIHHRSPTSVLHAQRRGCCDLTPHRLVAARSVAAVALALSLGPRLLPKLARSPPHHPTSKCCSRSNVRAASSPRRAQLPVPPAPLHPTPIPSSQPSPSFASWTYLTTASLHR